MPVISAPPQPSPELEQIVATPEASALLNELEAELAKLKKDRAILSSQNCKLIEQVEEKLKKESPLLAAEFVKGNIPTPELAEHYARMQDLLMKTSRLYDDIAKLKRGEKLVVESPQISDNDLQQIDALKTQIRALDSVIAKTGKKVKEGKPKNADRIVFWKEKLALANAKREDLKAQLKKLENGR